jgi:hypothetical protein
MLWARSGYVCIYMRVDQKVIHTEYLFTQQIFIQNNISSEKTEQWPTFPHSLSSDCCLAFHFPTSHIAAQSKGRASCNMLSDHAQASLAPSDNKPPGSAAYCKRHYALCHIQGLTWLKCDIKSLFCCHKPVHKCVLQCMPFWKWVACHASHHHNTDSPFSSLHHFAMLWQLMTLSLYTSTSC